MKHIKKYSLIIFALLFLLTINLANAEIQTLGTFQKDSTINLIQQCVNSTYANITRVTYSNSTFAINTYKSMIKNNDDYSYSYNLTSLSGEYLVYGICDEKGIKTDWQYNFFITPSGYKPELSQMIGYIFAVCIASCFFLISLFGFIKIKWKRPRNANGHIIGTNELKYFKIVFGVFSYFLLLFINLMAYGLFNSLPFYNGLARMFYLFWYGQLILLWIFIPLLVFFSIGNFLMDKRINKALERGIRVK